MKFTTVKKASEIQLEGYEVEFDHSDSSLNSVTILKDGDPVARFAMRSYTLYAERQSDPVMVDRYKLHGSVCGLPVERLFERESDAERAKQKYEEASQLTELSIDGVKVPDDYATATENSEPLPF